MTLEKIRVKDFQSIDKGEVELGSFTVFTGPSSSGKSAFLRAAQAVVRNSFTPAQVRMGAKEAVVAVEFEGHTVEAHRGKSKSTYVLDGEEYTKAGRNVPPPVEKTFQMPLIGEVETTFSTQFDKPYLIADPGSTAAKVLGTLTNVSVLHAGLREANRRGLSAKSTLKVKATDLEGVKERLKDYEDLDDQLDLLKRAEEIQAKVDAKVTEVGELEAALTSLARLTTRLEEVEASIIDPTPLEELLTVLTAKAKEVQDLDTTLIHIKRTAASLPKWNYSAVPDFPAELDEGIETLRNLSAALTTIQSKGKSYKAAAALSETSSTRKQEKEDELATLMSELKICPLCGQEMNGDHLD